MEVGKKRRGRPPKNLKTEENENVAKSSKRKAATDLESDNKRFKSTTSIENEAKSSTPKMESDDKKSRERKGRCKKCENCLLPNCGTCYYCKDMKKFGGPGLIKQCCEARKCLYKSLPTKTGDVKPTSFVPSPKLKRLMKSQTPFLQDRPCWKLPSALNRCRQCEADSRNEPTDEILCRFYLFRKLLFKKGNLTSIGFEVAGATTENDFKLLLPQEPADLDVNISRYILKYVVSNFCELVNQEKVIKNRFPENEISLKRSLQGVREMCDVCDTTIFNFHFVCDVCGFGVCIDCYDSNENLWMICISNRIHVKKKLMLTQIIPGNILWEINNLAHKVCKNNHISTNCLCGEDETDSLKSKNDKKSLDALEIIIHSLVDEYFKEKKDCNNENQSEVCKTDENPDIPHRWLCDGRLLWLTEPHHSKNIHLFQEIWKKGQPILISNVHKHLDENLWHPNAFSRDFGTLKNNLIDCRSGEVIQDKPMNNFWDGFEDPEMRLKDAKGQPRLLKLKDWPPGDDFSVVLPTRFDDLMKALPLPEYTHRDGKLNLTARLPSYFVPPDLGPKMYIAYGSTLFPDQGTTNLHLDMSDAVNVMVYAGVVKGKKEKKHIKRAFKEVVEAGCDALAQERVREEGIQLGAIWHIFKAEDAPKIRILLNDLIVENGEQVNAKSDPIHDQRFYLDSVLRERLRLEYGVEGCAIAQCVGDAVFIPAGAPHQVRNLHSCIKVAEDFVTPENIGHCIMLTQEFRHLSNSHTNHEDKLQIKNIAYHAIKDSLSVIMKV